MFSNAVCKYFETFISRPMHTLQSDRTTNVSWVAYKVGLSALSYQLTEFLHFPYKLVLVQFVLAVVSQFSVGISRVRYCGYGWRLSEWVRLFL